MFTNIEYTLYGEFTVVYGEFTVLGMLVSACDLSIEMMSLCGDLDCRQLMRAPTNRNECIIRVEMSFKIRLYKLLCYGRTPSFRNILIGRVPSSDLTRRGEGVDRSGFMSCRFSPPIPARYKQIPQCHPGREAKPKFNSDVPFLPLPERPADPLPPARRRPRRVPDDGPQRRLPHLPPRGHRLRPPDPGEDRARDRPRRRHQDAGTRRAVIIFIIGRPGDSSVVPAEAKPDCLL